MSLTFAAVGPSAYWYLARATGVVALLLSTMSVVLGVLGSVRFSHGPRWPRFTIDAMHRDVSLLVIVLLLIHIVTSGLDGFAPIKLIDAVVPFVSAYRPVWMGLGALAFDLLVALAVTSLLRRHLGLRTWRTIHWLAYASWPVAVLHGLGTGTDVKSWWMLLLTVACLAAVAAAVLTRIMGVESRSPRVRSGAFALLMATGLGLAIFTVAGPLQPGWARRAGTPLPLISGPSAARSGVSAPTAPASSLNHPFSASLSGTVTQEQAPGGAIVNLNLHVTGGVHGRLRIRLGGTPLDGGGLSMTGSQVDLGVDGMATVWEGHIVSLQGDDFVARIVGGSGSALDLHGTLRLGTDRVSGTLSGSPGGGG